MNRSPWILLPSVILPVFSQIGNPQKVEALTLGRQKQSEPTFERLRQPCSYGSWNDECENLPLPNSLADLVRQTIAQETGISQNLIRIAEAKHHWGPSSCGSFTMESRRIFNNGIGLMPLCTMDISPGNWLITAESDTHRWHYSIYGNRSISFNRQEILPTASSGSSGIQSSQPVPEPATLLASLGVLGFGGKMRQMLKRKKETE